MSNLSFGMCKTIEEVVIAVIIIGIMIVVGIFFAYDYMDIIGCIIAGILLVSIFELPVVNSIVYAPKNIYVVSYTVKDTVSDWVIYEYNNDATERKPISFYAIYKDKGIIKKIGNVNAEPYSKFMKENKKAIDHNIKIIKSFQNVNSTSAFISVSYGSIWTLVIPDKEYDDIINQVTSGKIVKGHSTGWDQN